MPRPASVRRCAFLTMDSLESFVCDDELAVGPLGELGWSVDFVSWRASGVDWSLFDLVVIRSTWDYQNDPDFFLDTLGEIRRSGTRLENSLDLVRWNLRKTYLLDLAGSGIPIVPTRWFSQVSGQAFAQLFREWEVEEIVVKPVVGANADHAYRIEEGRLSDTLQSLEESFSGREFMAQPFMRNILIEGEYSLFYFGGEHSHSIVKIPQEGDFRVQEEHGGDIRAAQPPAEILRRGRDVIQALPGRPLYGRVDLVRCDSGDYRVMEVELIEPALYFRMHSEAPRCFARVLDQWIGKPDLQVE